MDLVVKALLESYVDDTLSGAGALKGDKGDKGDAGEISVGTVTSGATASVDNSGTKTNAVFDFVLEKGDKGDTATVKVGSVTSGTTASVTNSGTNNDAVLDFVLEKGDKGDKGDNGITAQIFTGTDVTGDVDIIVDVLTSNVGDLYINTDTSNVYKRTDKLGTTNLWEKVGNIKGKEGDDAYEVAKSEGFIGTRAEWLESLHGEAKESLIVWSKPNINDEDTQLHTWYYYKVDGEDHGSGSAWLNRFNIPSTQDYPAGDYAFFNGINYLCFSCNTPIPALTTKDTTQYYVLYDEKNNQCQAHIVNIADNTETSLNWTDVTVSSTVLDGYTEVQPEGGCIQYGKWVQTIYLGSSKASAYDCTITTGASVAGFITLDTFKTTIGSLGLLTTADTSNVVNAINEVDGKFSNYVPMTDIVDSLTSADSTKPLSAKQGKELEDKKINKTSIATTIDATCTDDQVASAKAVYDIVPTDTHIKEISLLGELVADTTKYGDDILYFPCGVHIFESNAIANNFTNVPVKQAGTFYVTSITPNKDMNTDEYVYRNYRYETYYGVIYTRSLMTGSLSEGIRRDSGWNRVCTTKAQDVGVTSLASSILTDNATCNNFDYQVKNGICYVRVCMLYAKQIGNYTLLTSGSLPIPTMDNHMVYLHYWNDPTKGPICLEIRPDGTVWIRANTTENIPYSGTFSYPVAES